MKKYTFLEISGLSNFLVVCLALGVALNVVAVYGSILEYELISSIVQGEDYTQEQIDNNDFRQGIIGLLQVALMIVTAILFFKWTYRVINNAYTDENSQLSISPGWGIGYYFVPVLSLWKPYQALREAYDVYASRGVVDRDRILFPLWWAAWLISCSAGQVDFRVTSNAETAEQLLFATSVTIAADSWNILLNLITVMLVIHVTFACVEFQENRVSGRQFPDNTYDDDDFFT